MDLVSCWDSDFYHFREIETLLNTEGHGGLSREFVREEMELPGSHINKIFQTMMFTKNSFSVIEKSIM